ncbi:MAG: hypothetical protein NTW21_25660 [Verrucomicrobia bacterium]|nr:hypothetical protein [Verrucomicrobiota bacterium]
MPVRILHSPLTGTAGVLAALGLLAIPLRHLTTTSPVRLAAACPTADAATPAVLRLKLLTPARSIRVTAGDGGTLLDLTNVAAGESEHDTAITLRRGVLDLLLAADLGDSPSDTALFLTVMPDAREAQTRYAIGSGTRLEPLRYEWREP